MTWQTKVLGVLIPSLTFLAVGYSGKDAFQTRQEDTPVAPSIKGKITDAMTGEPLIGVVIAIKGANRRAVSGLDGTYRILDLKVGIFEIRVSTLTYRDTVVTGIEASNGRTTIADISLISCYDASGPIYEAALEKGRDSALTDIETENYFLIHDTTRWVYRGASIWDFFGTSKWLFSFVDVVLPACDSIIRAHGFTDGHDRFMTEYTNENEIPIVDMGRNRKYQELLKEYFEARRTEDVPPQILGRWNMAIYSSDSSYHVELRPDGLRVTNRIGAAVWYLQDILDEDSEIRMIEFFWGHVSEDYFVVHFQLPTSKQHCYFAIDLLDGTVTPESCDFGSK